MRSRSEVGRSWRASRPREPPLRFSRRPVPAPSLVWEPGEREEWLRPGHWSTRETWQQLLEEFKKGRQHYERLQMGDRMELTLHEGGHEAIVEPGIRFFNKWLKGKK